MTQSGRIVALSIAGVAAAGGAVLQWVGAGGAGLFIFAALIVVGTVFEARYRGSRAAMSGQWNDTGEREVDQETGTVLEVWFDPVSGDRRYVAGGQHHA